MIMLKTLASSAFGLTEREKENHDGKDPARVPCVSAAIHMTEVGDDV